MKPADEDTTPQELQARIESALREQRWADVLRWTDAYRQAFQADAAMLHNAGFAAAQSNDFLRAHRLMVDSQLMEFSPDRLPWLCAVYERLGWNLPAYVAAHWLKHHRAHVVGIERLYEKAAAQMRGELERRKLPWPHAEPLAYDDDQVKACNQRLAALIKADQLPSAIELGEGALLFYPFAESLLVNTALCHKRQRNFEAAGRLSLTALAVNPLGMAVITNFGNMLVQAGSIADATLLLEIGAILQRQDAALWSNLAVAYNSTRVAPWEAEMIARRALELNPQMAASWTALAGALSRQARIREAVQAYRQAALLDPERRFDELFNLNYADDLSVQDVAELHVQYGQHTGQRAAAQRLPAYPISPPQGRRLRVGLVSGDLVVHPVSYFLYDVLPELAKRVDIHVFHNRESKDEDAVSAHYRQHVQAWTSISQLSDTAAAQLIHQQRPDVLIDLSGHTAYHRLPMLALKPCPIQVTYLGYPNTTGLREMDWIYLDRRNLAPGYERFYTEAPYFLPHTALCYSPLIKHPELRASAKYAVSPTPALKNGYVTFGCCNNISKITVPVFEAWVELLRLVPNSRLLIEAPGFHQKDFKKAFIKRFSDQGIEPQRLVIYNRETEFQYVRYHEIDIALDPFPYGGGTTSCDVLWMGVPLVSHYQDRLMSRSGLAILSALGKPEWAHATVQGYVACARQLAADVPALNALRQQLRPMMQQSPLMNHAQFAQDLQNSFVHMINTHLAQQGKAEA